MPDLRTKLDDFVRLVGDDVAALGFLNSPDELSETSEYFYMGWIDVGGSWLIYRTDRLTSVRRVATIGSNAAHADLAAAWESRLTLVYV